MEVGVRDEGDLGGWGGFGWGWVGVEVACSAQHPSPARSGEPDKVLLQQMKGV